MAPAAAALFVPGLSTAELSLVGALFAAHPVHVEAVTSIVGRAELLSALFYFSALFAYAKYVVIDRMNGASFPLSSTHASSFPFPGASKGPRRFP